MTASILKKTIFNNKHKRVNSELFDEVRLSQGLSRFRLAIEVEMSPQTVTRLLSGGDCRPSTVKEIGEFLEIPVQNWYIKRESQKT